jgi:hypothetical protein
MKDDSDKRQHWLEQIADELALDNPNSDKETILRQMIARSRATATHRKLTNIYKPHGGAIRLTKIPHHTWYYDPRIDELYKFDEGVFYAYPSIGGLAPDDSRVFETHFEIKKPPAHIYHVDVMIDADFIQITHHYTTELLSWAEITDGDEMEQWFLRRNKKHLQQMWADHSFPTSDAFRPFAEEHGTCNLVQDLLDGKLDIDSFDYSDEAKEVLKVFQRTSEEKTISIERRLMTGAEFQASFKAANERTSSLPSGLHYGIWKAAAEVDNLAETHAQMTSLPFLYGFTCERWKKFIDCILEKSPGVVEIHTVRIIILVEGQWNTALKHYYPRLLMSEAEATGIHGDQWGGRFGRTAPDLQLQKMMFWEYGRFARLTLGANYGDLQSCYDRIPAFFSNMAAQKKGMWKENCISRAVTLLGSKRHIKTAAGISAGSYKNEAPQLNELKDLIEGEGQGKGDVGTLWDIISHILLTAHSNLVPGVLMMSANKKIEQRRVNDGYIDDVDNLADAPVTNRAPECIDRITQTAQMWAAIVVISGQIMGFHKGGYTVLAFMAVGGYLMHAYRRDFTGEVVLRNARGKATTIKYIPPNDGVKVDVSVVN